jgi:predicted AlkP superfamily phosphohydrolase/phosphomutase
MPAQKRQILLLSLVVLTCPHWGCGRGHSSAVTTQKKVIVLGIDAMDPGILDRLIREGKMPSFERLAKMGDERQVRTSIPPESPVAWSNFITGMNPGGHGIFDFIHRDPKTMVPFLSTSKTEAGDKSIHIGDWILPLTAGKVTLLRQGQSFWEILHARGVSTTVIRCPANFPPTKGSGIQLSGMGTPDILGGYGTFSFYTDEPLEKYQGITGGEVYSVKVSNQIIHTQLIGPRNTFRSKSPRCQIDFTVYVDAEHPVAKIVIQDKQILLPEKTWTPWIRVKFELIPYLQSVNGICRFYLQAIRPHFKLYVSPINLDPATPAMPISEPGDYSSTLADQIGLFYTQGIPEDTKALSAGILDDGEFLEQVRLVSSEILSMYDYELGRFHSGVLYFYFGSIDALQHMFWRTMDPQHPAHDSASPYTRVIEDAYREMDEVLGRTLRKVDEQTTLIVLSDHGFAPFYRAFSLNTWLKNNAYVSLNNFSEGELLNNVDWNNTRAYGLGFAGLYINLKGREKKGIVEPGKEREALLKELTEKLLSIRDPKNEEQIILRVYRTDEVYNGPYKQDAPDLIIGYNRGYRASWETTLGKFPRELLRDNQEKWSGDHLMAPEVVPGILLVNRKIKAAAPALSDLAPTILAEFGVSKPDDMVGNNVF